MVVATLTTIYAADTSVDLGEVFGLCKLVEELYEAKIPPDSPTVGEFVYLYAWGRTNAILRGDWFVWKNMKAEAMGQKRGLRWTAHALKGGGIADALTALKVKQMGLTYTEEPFAQVCASLRELFAEKNYATDLEKERPVRQVIRT
ncbi:MAG: hypothetical protein ABIH46_00095 [Chloroflexota bacterium]